MKRKDPKDPCANCKHLGESIYNVDPPTCYYCRKPEYGHWE